MKKYFTLFVLFWPFVIYAQTFQTTPAFPIADQSLTLSVDVSGTSLEGYSGDVWIWTWLPNCSADCDAPTNVNPATSSQNDAEMLRSEADPDVYAITFTPTTFFNKTEDAITRIGFKLKSVDWGDNKQTDVDLFFDISTGELEVAFSIPAPGNILVNTNDIINITAQASQMVDLTLSIGGVNVLSTSGTAINYAHTVTEMSGSVEVIVLASDGMNSVQDVFDYIIREATVLESRPVGIQDGINYDVEDATKVTLSLLAPGKTSVYVLGEFNNWQIAPAYQMKLDGEHFWIEITGLTSGQEYAYQYWVDESLYIGDPYTDKILDPDNDPFISSSTYPDLKAYPPGGNGLVSVFQTNQTPYDWQVNDFVSPDKEDLVIYELLIRDFEDGHNYQSLLDRLNYLEELGINAIELMPIMEFDGNLSWGYNPGYFFAPDKYYGTKNNLKALIDECHKRGIAVILDMVLNQTHEDNPLAQLYWDENQFKPAANNPWLNVDAKHPFNVFFDFNHESTYTQNFVDNVNHYWLEEYRFDGFRFDLSKGFTQKNTGNNVDAWSAYDQSRVDIIKRMTDQIWASYPDAYVILEHLADNSEEKVLANYGMMLWGNMNHNFNQLTMGYSQDSNIDWAYFGMRNWNEPNLIPYMESHDEERLMYRNINFGNTSNGGYDVKNLDIALERIKTASVIYYAIPGPKMLWQFGELGYDISIDLDGRTGEKPIPWSTSMDALTYDIDINRTRLYDLTSAVIQLKTTYDVFKQDNFTINESQSLVKQIQLLNEPFTSSPAVPEDMNVVIVSNFNVSTTDVDTSFPHTGNWYHYLAAGELLTVSSTTETISLQPGEFRIYTDVRLPSTKAELTAYVQPLAPTNLSLELVERQGVLLNWEDNSVIENNYEIWRSENGGSMELIDTQSRNSETYLDENVVANVTYTYMVIASNEHFESNSNQESIAATDIITGVDDVLFDDTFEVFPNPFSNILHLKSSEVFQEVKIVDLTGKIQKHYKSNDVKGVKLIDIDVSDLLTGIYLIQFKGSSISSAFKVIKQN